jgi:hypothetical protein
MRRERATGWEQLIGQAAYPGMSTSSGDMVVLAVQRKGEAQGPAATRLAVGDTLLLQGSWDALDEHLDDPDVLVVDSPELIRRQAVPLGPGPGGPRPYSPPWWCCWPPAWSRPRRPGCWPPGR